ncbi:MAG: M20 family metallopeptidase [Candidatus Omnitrophica bacterium]|nr:M20 family metallopeptidase [Candidatus Omnitrophota bacterium]
MINKKRLLELTQKLICINSENPGGDEYKIAYFLRDYLNKYRIKTKLYAFKDKRINLLATIDGRGKKTLLLNPHLDTVPAGGNWRYPAFGGVIFKDRIYGRGASDDKGNLAVAVEAIINLLEEDINLDYKLILAATADEESGSHLGIIPLLDRGIVKPDMAVVLDSDEFNIITSQKGLIHLKVKIFGKKAHGAYPWKGENAIEKAVDILREIKQFKFRFRPHPLLKPPTVNFGTMHGGDRVNIVSDWCEFELDIRFLPGMSHKKILEDFKKIIKKYTKKFKMEIEALQMPFDIEKSNPLVKYLIYALKKNKINFSIKGSEGATTITFFKEKNIPAVGFGIGVSGQAHSTDEYVRIDYLYRGAEVLKDFLVNFKFD